MASFTLSSSAATESLSRARGKVTIRGSLASSAVPCALAFQSKGEMMHLVREMDMYVYCVTHPTVVYLDNAPRELTGMHGRRSENR